MSALLGTGSIAARHLLSEYAAITLLSLFTLLFGFITSLYSCYPIGFFLLALIPINLISVKSFYASGL